VATLLPYVQDAIARVGGCEVVATVRRSMPEAPPAPMVDRGSPHGPSYERLAEARPQLVVGDKQMHAAVRDRLARSGAEVLLVESDSVDGTFAGLLEIGRRCGVADAMAAQIDAVRRTLGEEKLAKPMPILLLFGTPGSFLVVSNRTWLGDLAQRLSFENLGAAATGKEQHPGYIQVSDEALASLRPAGILMVAHGDPEAIRATFARRLDPGGPWAGMHDDATLGVHVLPAALFSQNPGLGMAESARHLRSLAKR
jgi:iron complex transport system substrate-binding protein